MKSTKLMQRIYSAQSNNESKILTQIYADLQTARNQGKLHTTQVDYDMKRDGTIIAKDKVNNEVTSIGMDGDQIVMKAGDDNGMIVPSKDIVSELEGTPSIPDDVFKASTGVHDKEKAGLVGNEDTHYPSITFSIGTPVYSQSDIVKVFSEIGITKEFTEQSPEQKTEKLDAAKKEAADEKAKYDEMKRKGGITRGEQLYQQGKTMMSQAKVQALQGATTGALSGAATSAVVGMMTGGPIGATTGAIRGLIGAGIGALYRIPQYIEGKKIMMQGKKLIAQENKDPELKKRNTIQPKIVVQKEMSKAGHKDDLQLIVGKLQAIKNAASNSDKNKIVVEIKDISRKITDSNSRRYLLPMIKELEKRSIKSDDFDTIVSDFINEFSNNPITKVFNKN